MFLVEFLERLLDVVGVSDIRTKTEAQKIPINQKLHQKQQKQFSKLKKLSHSDDPIEYIYIITNNIHKILYDAILLFMICIYLYNDSIVKLQFSINYLLYMIYIKTLYIKFIIYSKNVILININII